MNIVLTFERSRASISSPASSYKYSSGFLPFIQVIVISYASAWPGCKKNNEETIRILVAFRKSSLLSLIECSDETANLGQMLRWKNWNQENFEYVLWYLFQKAFHFRQMVQTSASAGNNFSFWCWKNCHREEDDPYKCLLAVAVDHWHVLQWILNPTMKKISAGGKLIPRQPSRGIAIFCRAPTTPSFVFYAYLNVYLVIRWETKKFESPVENVS